MYDGMDRWKGKVAIVTGASAGIGLAIAKSLMQQGMIVIGFARNNTKMEDEMKDIALGPGEFYARKCDVSKKEDVDGSFAWAKDTFGSLNVLVNNAGVMYNSKIQETEVEAMEHQINVNILGWLHCTKQAITLMKENQSEAHIVTISSFLGKLVPSIAKGLFSIYPATKFAVTALSESLRNELVDTKIRTTNISPGPVNTSMSSAMKSSIILSTVSKLKPEDVASSVIYALSVPPHVEIKELTILPKGYIV